ncbi:MAG TPA: hypothetical protein ENJ53_11055, partial [Phaeodactylibacter sp.]|nr:hypothetical protein [Phaeodactylibacter sp.]
MNKITLIIIWFFSFAILGEAQIYHGFNANNSGQENEIGITNDLSACDFTPAFSLNHTITEIAFTPDGS